MQRTKIEWAEVVWNPVTGCSPISVGCEHCYAMRWAERLKAMGVKGYEKGFEVTYHPEKLEEPLKRKKPSVVFCVSMGDLFHKDVDDSWIVDILTVMRETPQHKYIVLTKRPKRATSFAEEISLVPNLWLGITAENNQLFWERMKHLSQIPAHRFISFEPLLGAVDPMVIRYYADKIEGVIVGGETGPGAREMRKEWVDLIWEVCVEQGLKFFFKQWGGKRGKDRIYRGREWNELPWR
jgi:protein gp37